MSASVKPLPKSKRNPSTNNSKPKQLGVFGEDRAAFFLTSRGFHVLARNIRIGRGEIDIVAWDPGSSELVFVEVKTRHQNYSGDPSLAVDRRKLTALRRACQAYRREIWRRNTPFRLDILAVIPGKILHYRNITWEWYS